MHGTIPGRAAVSRVRCDFANAIFCTNTMDVSSFINIHMYSHVKNAFDLCRSNALLLRVNSQLSAVSLNFLLAPPYMCVCGLCAVTVRFVCVYLV
jgi:hypothetical protein